MNPANPVNTNQNQIRIVSKAFDTDITVTAKQPSIDKPTSKISSLVANINEKLTARKYIKLNVDGKEVLVKISELCIKLGISNQNELIKASKNSDGSIANVLVNLKCQAANARLNDFYAKTKPKGREARAEHLKERETVKNVLRLAYLSMARSPKSSGQEIILPVRNHKIIVKDTSEGLKIATLYGRQLGSGTQGEALQSLDLMTGKDGDVVKLPKEKRYEEELRHEAAILNKLNPTSNVLGLQKPVRLVADMLQVTKLEDKKTGETFSTYGHLGSRYDSDLSKVNRNSVPLNDQLSIAYQLLNGLDHMHKQNITHGDIKPENIFYDRPRDDNVGPRVYLADFGGVLDHANLVRSHSLPVTTKAYRVVADTKASKAAFLSLNKSLQRNIEVKADVFATCLSLCRTFLPPSRTNPHFPFLNNGSEEPTDNLDPALKKALVNAGISEATADLLIQGMNLDYTKRPEVSTLLQAVQIDLERVDPKRASAMKNLRNET